MSGYDPRRQAELAKIHIAPKDLGLDDATYRTIIREVGKAESGSAGDLTPAGRARVLAHFKEKGWKPRKKAGARTRSRQKAPEMASDGEIRLIRHIWLCLAEDGVVKSREESSLRTWTRSSTRRYHPKRTGYSAPEFLPAWVANKLIEQLKKWAARCDVDWK